MKGAFADIAMLLMKKEGAGGRVEALEKRVDTLYRLSEGALYDTETDAQAGYAKTVPSGAVAAEINSIGGKSDTQNGELACAAVTGVVSRNADGELLGTMELPQTLLAYLADKDYGMGAGTAANVLDLEAGKYIRGAMSMKLSAAEFRTSSYLTTDDHNGYTATLGSEYPRGSGSRLYEDIVTTMEALGYTKNTMTDFNQMTSDLKTNSMKYAVRVSTQGELMMYISDFGAATLAAIQAKLADVTAVFGVPAETEYDVSALLPDNLLPVEADGSLTFVQADGTELDVPNSVDYLIKLSEVTP